MAPLILTLTLDPWAQELFNQLRKRHFPPERNFLQAHLTLFHHLPAGEQDIYTVIEKICGAQPPMCLHVSAVTGIGRGVAYKIECPELLQLHRYLQQQWQQWLIPQDRQKLWPHITVQNKVSPDTAKMLQQELAHSFQPFDIIGTGFTLWEYLGGPWKWLQDFSFSTKSQAQQV